MVRPENPHFDTEPAGLEQVQERCELLAAEFPGWEPFRGIDQLWHARIPGATPPVMVHGESSLDLRDKLITWHRQNQDDN
jgi:hypothetical protein